MKNPMNENVLVLSRLWQATAVCTVSRAFTLLCVGHAKVVIDAENNNFPTFELAEWEEFSREYAGDDVVHSAKNRYKIPRVILLLFFDRIVGKEVKFTRHSIFERDGHKCQYCGNKFNDKHLNLDHVIPRDMGGATTWENIVCSCIKCNTLKANKTPTQAGLKLLSKPKRPKWQPMMKVSIKDVYHPDWKHFVDLAYHPEVDLGEK